MTTHILGILRGTSHGTTLPLLSRGGGGCLYYVKGKGTRWRAFISEPGAPVLR